MRFISLRPLLAVSLSISLILGGFPATGLTEDATQSPEPAPQVSEGLENNMDQNGESSETVEPELSAAEANETPVESVPETSAASPEVILPQTSETAEMPEDPSVDAAPQIEFPDDLLAPTDEPTQTEPIMEASMSLDAEPSPSATVEAEPMVDAHLPENIPCSAKPAEMPTLGASFASVKNGSWTNPEVWGYEEKSGKYPQPEDVVQVSHRIGLDIKGSQNKVLSGLIVDGFGELSNSYYSQSLTINGPLVNLGKIAVADVNSPYGLGFSVGGTIWNSGEFHVTGLSLLGGGQRTIAPGGTFTVVNTWNTGIGLDGDVTLAGCVSLKSRIDLNGFTLTIPEGSQLSAWNLMGSGALAGDGMIRLDGNTYDPPQLTGGTEYLVFNRNGDTNLNGEYAAQKIILTGSGTRNILNPLILNGDTIVRPGILLKGGGGYGNHITVNGDFNNAGILEDYGQDLFHFGLTVHGDLTNSGTIGKDGRGGSFHTNFDGNFYSDTTAIYYTKEFNAKWQPIQGSNGYRVRFQDASSGAVQTVEADSPMINLYSRRNGSYFWRAQPLYGENDERWAGDFSGIRTVNIRPEEVPAALLVLSPDGGDLLPLMSYDFGGQETRTAGERTFQLENFGNETLAFHPENALSLEGPDAGDFRIGEFEPELLAPNQSRGVAVTFAPGTPGPKSATLVIRSSDPFFPEFRISLTGSAHSDTATLHSRFEGGAWGTAATWLEGRVPTTTDIVEILGPVTTTSQDPVVAGLLIGEGGSLSGGSSGYSLFTVNGAFRNEGRVANDIVSSKSSGIGLEVYGDAINRGSLENAFLRINGNADREISGTFPLNVTINGHFALTGEPVFSGESFSMSNQAEMRMPPEGKVRVTGAAIDNVRMAGGQLFLSGGNQTIGDLTAAEIILGGSGVKTVARPHFYGNLTIEEGIIVQDYYDSWGELTVHGNLTNRGIIRHKLKGPYDNFYNRLYVNVTGDILNDGDWTTATTRATWEPIAGVTGYEFAIAPLTQEYPAAKAYSAVSKVDISDKLTTAWHWRTRAKLADGSYTEWIERTINNNPNTPPTLMLLGDNPLFLTEGDHYLEPGVIAEDDEDSNIESLVKTFYFRELAPEEFEVLTEFNAPPAGKYHILYTLTDSDGMRAENITRTVIVYPKPELKFSAEPGFVDRGTDKVKATADEEEITFKIIFTDARGQLPGPLQMVDKHFPRDGSGPLSERLDMQPDTEAETEALRNGDTRDGEQYVFRGTFSSGIHEYRFEAWQEGKLLAELSGDEQRFETGYSNVVFFPGILASRLYKDVGFPHRLWEPTIASANSDIAALAMDENGDSRLEDVYAKDAIDEPLGLGMSENVYKKWLEELEQWKADGSINDYEVMPYDWRLPFEYVIRNSRKDGEKIHFDSPEGYFISQVENLAKSAANGKVTIIGHSMGGFMAKTLIDQLTDTSIVENLILVASPQLGTPQAIPSLLHGDDQYLFSLFNNNADIPNWGLFHLSDAKQARELVRNMITEYVLLPHKKYFEYVNDIDSGGGAYGNTSVITLNASLQNLEAKDPDIKKLLVSYYAQNPISNYDDYTAFLKGDEGRDQPDVDNVAKPIKVNAEIFDRATEIQDNMDAWTPPPGLKVTQIAGWGKYTVKGITYYAYNVNAGTLVAPVYRLDVRPEETIDGDGTVVLPSAVALETPGTGDDPYEFGVTPNLETYFVDIKGYNASGILNSTKNRKHSNILEIEYLRKLIGKIIQHESINPSVDPDLRFIRASRPYDNDKHLRLSVHSPVAIDVYDTSGNHTGIVYDPNAAGQKYFIEEGIPNSSFLFFGEGKYLTLPEDHEYRVELKGLDYGSFTYELEEKQGDILLSTKTLENIPVGPQTKATMTITTLADASPLVIDADGDGEPEASLSPNENGGGISAEAELGLVSVILGTMDMDAGLKATLLKKMLLAQNFLDKGKPDKAKKMLQKVVKRLEKETKRNDSLQKQTAKQQAAQEKLQGKIDEVFQQLAIEDSVDVTDDAEDEKSFKELQKEAKKNAKLQKRLDKLETLLNRKTSQWDAWKIKHPGERISTESAQMLIILVKRVIGRLE